MNIIGLKSNLTGLRAIDQLARNCNEFPWFALVGRDRTDRCDSRLEIYIESGLEVRLATSWSQVRDLAVSRSDDDTWQAESDRLKAIGADRYGSSLLQALIVELVAAATSSSHAAAASAATRDGIGDGDVVRLAASDAASAARHAGLALAAHEDQHRFIDWLGIFANGRWPIGITAGILWVF